MSALKFRNITASIDDPVETWPFEGILAAVERGTLPDWRRLAAAIRADPWGPVAQQVLEAIDLSRPYGTTELLTTVIECARLDAADDEREQVAGEIRDLVIRSGLSQQDFSLRLGTSRPRLSTYMSGKVTPSASLMLRIRRVAAQAKARDGRPRPGRLVKLSGDPAHDGSADVTGQADVRRPIDALTAYYQRVI
jgi:transcriptional regulator with XRE-family HTH domain